MKNVIPNKYREGHVMKREHSLTRGETLRQKVVCHELLLEESYALLRGAQEYNLCMKSFERKRQILGFNRHMSKNDCDLKNHADVLVHTATTPM